MKKFWEFFVKLVKKFNENELLYMGNELTYKMLIALFPLLIYIINVLALFGLKYDIFSLENSQTVPSTVTIIIGGFLNSIKPIAESENISSIMNLSLIFALISGSSGFYSIIRGINRSYGVKDERSILVKELLSVVLVILFSITILGSGLLLVFSDVIINFISELGFDFVGDNFIQTFKYVVSIFFILVNVMAVYKVASYKKISFKSTFPGAVVTVIAWILSSFVFNIYVNNYSKFNAIYGAIGSMLIFIFWINIIAVVLLIGSQINAIIYEDKHKLKE